jgi:hypothetical protein
MMNVMDCRRGLPHVSGEIKRLGRLICRNLVNGKNFAQSGGALPLDCRPGLRRYQKS